MSHPSPLPDAPFHLFQRSSQAAKADLYVNAATGLIISDASEALGLDDLSGRVIDLDGNLLAPGLIDAQATMLREHQDDDLSERLFGDADALAALVQKHLHCG